MFRVWSGWMRFRAAVEWQPFSQVTGEDFLCGFNLCADQTVNAKNYRGALSRIFERRERLR
jgi:hypothetical protein